MSSISIISSPFWSFTEKSPLKNHLYARSAMILVSTKSNPPPTIAPTPGRSFPKLTIPFVPNFVINLNPTFWFIFVKTLPGIFLISPFVNFTPIFIPACFNKHIWRFVSDHYLIHNLPYMQHRQSSSFVHISHSQR